jgi:dTDP-4-dehydrorhamnose reductase
MKILVTGVSGQVGSAIARRFATLGEIIPADRSVLDLARPQSVAAQLDHLNPDLVINPAAYTAVDKAEDEKELAQTINGGSPGAVAAWAQKNGVPLVHFSTDYVFDGSGRRPWKEDDRTGPLNVYGATKLAGEQAVAASGAAHLIVRTSWVYAASGTNFLRTVAKLAREKSELTMIADQIGAPTSAACIADILARIVEANSSDLHGAFASAGGKIHLTAGGQTSWHGFAEAIVAGLKRRGAQLAVERIRPIPNTEYPRPAKRPLNSRLDLTRLTQAFQVTPKPWEGLLEAELDAFKAMGDGAR